MPLPLKFTVRATALLSASLQKQEREPEEVVRLLIDPEGNVRLALDIPRDGDIRVEHRGITTIVVEPAICVLLSNVIIDSQEPANGLSFTIKRNLDSN